MELFDVEYYGDLEMWVRGHSRSLKLVPFESLSHVGCGSLFAVHISNCDALLYRLRDIATIWSKIAKFLYPTCIWRPHRNFANMFDTDKTVDCLGYRVVKKIWQYVKPFP